MGKIKTDDSGASGAGRLAEREYSDIKTYANILISYTRELAI